MECRFGLDEEYFGVIHQTVGVVVAHEGLVVHEGFVLLVAVAVVDRASRDGAFPGIAVGGARFGPDAQTRVEFGVGVFVDHHFDDLLRDMVIARKSILCAIGIGVELVAVVGVRAGILDQGIVVIRREHRIRSRIGNDGADALGDRGRKFVAPSAHPHQDAQ